MATGHACTFSEARTEELGLGLAKVQQRYFMDYLRQVFKDKGIQFYFPSQVSLLLLQKKTTTLSQKGMPHLAFG